MVGRALSQIFFVPLFLFFIRAPGPEKFTLIPSQHLTVQSHQYFFQASNSKSPLCFISFTLLVPFFKFQDNFLNAHLTFFKRPSVTSQAFFDQISAQFLSVIFFNPKGVLLKNYYPSLCFSLLENQGRELNKSRTKLLLFLLSYDTFQGYLVTVLTKASFQSSEQNRMLIEFSSSTLPIFLLIDTTEISNFIIKFNRINIMAQ